MGSEMCIRDRYKASSTDVFPEPFAPCIKLFNFENSISAPSKHRKFEIDILFIDTFRLKAASLHILNLGRQTGLLDSFYLSRKGLYCSLLNLC